MATPNPGLYTLPAAESRHLWEVDHPYYCNDGNYFSSEAISEWGSWADYLSEFEDSDKDYNLVFRWDWKVADPDDYDTEGKYGDPEEVPTEEYLHLYHMQQRKGCFWTHIVEVKREDEESIREYLTGYAEHMRQLWKPLL